MRQKFYQMGQIKLSIRKLLNDYHQNCKLLVECFGFNLIQLE